MMDLLVHDHVEVRTGPCWREGWLDSDTWHRGSNGRWRARVQWTMAPAQTHVDYFEQDDIRKVGERRGAGQT